MDGKGRRQGMGRGGSRGWEAEEEVRGWEGEEAGDRKGRKQRTEVIEGKNSQNQSAVHKAIPV